MLSDIVVIAVFLFSVVLTVAAGRGTPWFARIHRPSQMTMIFAAVSVATWKFFGMRIFIKMLKVGLAITPDAPLRSFGGAIAELDGAMQSMNVVLVSAVLAAAYTEILGRIVRKQDDAGSTNP